MNNYVSCSSHTATASNGPTAVTTTIANGAPADWRSAGGSAEPEPESRPLVQRRRTATRVVGADEADAAAKRRAQ